MAMERNFFEREAQFASEEDLTLKQNWKSVTAPSSVSSGNNSGSFECNICLDSAHDPVVTLCGHLYCWPCIYKWLNVNNPSLEADLQQPTCPVCKANISPNSVVPLYGRGMSTSESETKKATEDTVIPRRPQPSGLSTESINMSSQSQQLHPNLFQSQSQSFHNHQYFPDPYGGYAAVTSSNLGGTTMTGIFNPMIGMFGELMFARIFGASDPSLFAYSYPNSPVMGPNNLRVRRQEMHLEKSLNRLSTFFLCCIILCLLLF